MMQFMKRLLLFPLTGLGLALLVVALLLASNLYTYYRLTDEVPIAELRFRPLGPQRFEARIAFGDFCHEQVYALDGDQFRLDARFLKWRPWANLLGFDALYRIERLGGRYAAVARENRAPHRAYPLNPQQRIDLPAVLARYQGSLSPVDTLYGSSVYDNMEPGFLFRVYRGQSGLLVRKVPLQPPAGLTIDIRRSCGESSRSAGRLAGWLVRLAGVRDAAGPDEEDKDK
jgi:hypothetical protein